MSFAAVILAGGKSSRMGRDKADLIWDEQPLYLHQKNTALNAGFDLVVVSRNKDGFLQDNAKEKGPLAGILAALQDKNIQQKQYLCVLPVDMPYVTSAMLQALMNAAKTSSIICFENETFPFMLKVSLSHRLQEYLKTQKSVRGFISSQEITHISAKPFIDNFININTPQHLKDALISNDKIKS